MFRPSDNYEFSAAQVVRHKAPSAAKGHSLSKDGNAVVGRLGSALRVGLRASMDGVTPFDKGPTFACEACLVMNARRPTESVTIRWSEH